MSTLVRHAPFCVEHDFDEDADSCATEPIEVEDWDVTLVAGRESAIVWLRHPALILVSGEGSLTPDQAIELGRALILQGTRGLEEQRRRLANIHQSDDLSVSGTAYGSGGVH